MRFAFISRHVPTTGQLQLAGPWRIRGGADIQADTMTLGGSLVSGGNLFVNPPI